MEAKPMNRMKITHTVKNVPELKHIEYTIDTEINGVHIVLTGTGDSIDEAKTRAKSRMYERLCDYFEEELNNALKD